MRRGTRRSAWPAGALFVSVLCAWPSAQSPVVADRQIEAGGHRLHYLEAGSGPPVVLLHGLGADVRAWRYTVPALASSNHVYAVDLLGFGQSDKPQVAYRVSTLADSVAALLDALHVDKASVVGNSLGGWVAIKFATSHPDRVDRLILADAAGYGQDPSEMVRDYLSQFDPATVAAAEQFLKGLSPEDQRLVESAAVLYFAQRSPRGDGYAVASIVESILRGEDALGAEVKGIRAPTLVIWGRNDPVIPLRVGDALAADIPGAAYAVLDGCGHRPQTECSAAFNLRVLKFLAGRTN